MSSPLPEPVLAAVARRLIRHFLAEDGDTAAALRTARDALAAYKPQTLTDCLAAARLIALSFDTLLASDKAADPEIPEKQQLQYLAKANALSRAARQEEAAIAAARTEPAAPPEPGLRYPTEDEVEVMFDNLMTEIHANPGLKPADPGGHAFWNGLQQCAEMHVAKQGTRPTQPAAQPGQPRPTATPPRPAAMAK